MTRHEAGIYACLALAAGCLAAACAMALPGNSFYALIMPAPIAPMLVGAVQFRRGEFLAAFSGIWLGMFGCVMLLVVVLSAAGPTLLLTLALIAALAASVANAVVWRAWRTLN